MELHWMENPVVKCLLSRIWNLNLEEQIGVICQRLNITNIDLISPSSVEFVYNEERNSWIASSEDSFQNLLTSNNRIVADGFDLKIFGSPKNGDVITLDNVSGAAKTWVFVKKTSRTSSCFTYNCDTK